MCAYSRLVTGLSCLCFALEKTSLSLVFFVFLGFTSEKALLYFFRFFSSYLFTCAANNRSTQRVGRQATKTYTTNLF